MTQELDGSSIPHATCKVSPLSKPWFPYLQKGNGVGCQNTGNTVNNIVLTLCSDRWKLDRHRKSFNNGTKILSHYAVHLKLISYASYTSIFKRPPKRKGTLRTNAVQPQEGHECQESNDLCP